MQKMRAALTSRGATVAQRTFFAPLFSTVAPANILTQFAQSSSTGRKVGATNTAPKNNL